MPSRWETFARNNADYYIHTGLGDESDPAASARFFESGRYTAAWIFDDVANDLPARELAIEFGCGVGRVLIPMAGRFAGAVGVDVAPTMLAKLRTNCERFGVTNVRDAPFDEQWEHDARADLVYSWLVFQHLADFRVLDTAIRRLAAALKDRGIAVLQFDTRPRSPGYLLRNALPGPLLPRSWRRGIRRIRRVPRAIEDVLRGAGLSPMRTYGAGTAVHVYVLRRG